MIAEDMQAESMQTEGMQSIAIDRKRKLEYLVSGEGKPLLFLHGMGGSIRQIQGMYDPIDGIRMIAPNLQGHGGSEPDWEHYDFGHLADDALAVLDALGEKQVIAAGVSMGAAVALNLALRCPERISRLVLIRNAWTWEPMDADRQLAYRDLGECLAQMKENENAGTDWEKWAGHFRESAGGHIVEATGSEYTRNAFEIPFREDFNVRWNRKFGILPPLAPVNGEEMLYSLKIPVLIIGCRNDFCHPFERSLALHERISGSLMKEVPSKDEDSRQHRDLINRYMREFLL